MSRAPPCLVEGTDVTPSHVRTLRRHAVNPVGPAHAGACVNAEPENVDRIDAKSFSALVGVAMDGEE